MKEIKRKKFGFGKPGDPIYRKCYEPFAHVVEHKVISVNERFQVMTITDIDHYISCNSLGSKRGIEQPVFFYWTREEAEEDLNFRMYLAKKIRFHANKNLLLGNFSMENLWRIANIAGIISKSKTKTAYRIRKNT